MRFIPQFVFAIAVVTIAALSLAARAEEGVAAPANSIGMRFVRIPAGAYERGFSTDNGGEHRFHLAHPYSNSQSFRRETPSHNVKLTRSFDLAASEVTVGQFRRFVEATKYVTEAEKSGGGLGYFPAEKDYVDRVHQDAKITWRSPGFEQTEMHPVTGVSWNDAQAFVQWLSKKEDATYRLPTEAEWEYACKAGAKTWYSWGEDPDDAYTHANVADGALEAAHPKTTQYQRAVRLQANEGDGVVFTAKVMSYKPNAWGLFDMHGNVWEWCEDRWSADVYQRFFDGVERQKRGEVVVIDPLFSKETDQHKYGDWRVLRGGGWTCAPASVRCSIRTYAEAGDAAVYTGFRVVREVAP